MKGETSVGLGFSIQRFFQIGIIRHYLRATQACGFALLVKPLAHRPQPAFRQLAADDWKNFDYLLAYTAR
jgi:hypothetical protein